MSIIGAIQTYLKTYSSLKSGAPVWVDYLGPQPTEYSVQPMPGTKVIERYLDGGSLREFPFVFTSTESTADDPERLNTIGFYEAFSDWMDSQTDAGVFPTLSAKQEAIRLEAITGGYLFDQGGSSTGIYQIVCKLTYTQQP